jgi:hypothetical protein
MNKEMLKDQIYDWIIANNKHAGVYGYARFGIDRVIKEDGVDLKGLLDVIAKAIHDAHFFQTGESDEEIFNNICHLFYVDPMLVKCM